MHYSALPAPGTIGLANGRCRPASGHIELARHDYEQAIRLAPDYADGYFNRGVLNTDQDRLTEAEQDYRQAIALEPEHESAQFALGVCWLALGQWQQGWPQPCPAPPKKGFAGSALCIISAAITEE